MKTQKIIIQKIVLAIVCVLFFTSCNQWFNVKSITGSGNITTETRKTTQKFTGIKVSNSLEVVIEQGDNIEVRVEADDNLQKSIFTKVENGVLIISCEYDNFINVSSKKVIVKMPTVETLKASSGSSISNNKSLIIAALTINSSSAATINLKMESDKIKCEASSGSKIYLSGLALQLETTASSGSQIDAKDLAANEIIAKSSSGASISVHPIVNLQATASSGSSITYNKVPKQIEKKTSSGASISFN